MTGGADSWSQPSVFSFFHCGRLVHVFMTIASYFSGPFDLIERGGVSVYVGGREVPVPPSLLCLIESYQPALDFWELLLNFNTSACSSLGTPPKPAILRECVTHILLSKWYALWLMVRRSACRSSLLFQLIQRTQLFPLLTLRALFSPSSSPFRSLNDLNLHATMLVIGCLHLTAFQSEGGQNSR